MQRCTLSHSPLGRGCRELEAERWLVATHPCAVVCRLFAPVAPVRSSCTGCTNAALVCPQLMRGFERGELEQATRTLGICNNLE